MISQSFSFSIEFIFLFCYKWLAASYSTIYTRLYRTTQNTNNIQSVHSGLNCLKCCSRGLEGCPLYKILFMYVAINTLAINSTKKKTTHSICILVWYNKMENASLLKRFFFSYFSLLLCNWQFRSQIKDSHIRMDNIEFNK